MSQASSPSMVRSFGRRVTRTVEIAITTTIAWAFGAATAGLVGYIAYLQWSGQKGPTTPFHFLDPAESAQPWGLTFQNANAPYIAGGMAAAVMLALALSMMAASTPRRLGLLFMLGWAGLWMTDAIIFTAASWRDSWWSAGNQILAATLALFVIFACMFHRASRLWRIKVSL